MTLRARLLPPEDFIRGRNDNKNPATRRGLCPTIMDGQNVIPQNAPGSTIGNLPSECPRINDRQPGRGFATPKNADFFIYRTACKLQGII